MYGTYNKIKKCGVHQHQIVLEISKAKLNSLLIPSKGYALILFQSFHLLFLQIKSIIKIASTNTIFMLELRITSKDNQDFLCLFRGITTGRLIITIDFRLKLINNESYLLIIYNSSLGRMCNHYTFSQNNLAKTINKKQNEK